jgi:hypothetical protein
MTTIFLQLENQWYKYWVGTSTSSYLNILKKVWIIFNYKIFKLTLYKLGLIPSSLCSKHKTAWSNCVTKFLTKRLEMFLGKCVFYNRSCDIMRGKKVYNCYI